MSSIDSKGKLNRRTALKLAGLAAGAAVLPRPSLASADHRESCLRTRLSSKFGLRVPLASAGMAFVALPELAAAVSNAGAIGVYGVGPEPPPVLSARIAAITARTTDATPTGASRERRISAGTTSTRSPSRPQKVCARRLLRFRRRP